MVTVDRGITGTVIRLDACAQTWFAQASDGIAVPEFQVVYQSHMGGISLLDTPQPLSDQAVQAVRNTLDVHGDDFRQDDRFCRKMRASLTIRQVYLGNFWNDLNDPSQWVLDHVGTAQFQSGC
ncbi:hypothetical protein KDA_46800 [Dictyobacter alpinus]|uniref:Uncharacterized protein n=1 Tax=Dictyobacter alpinus TaxID=2014873 RepID=A0A402BCY1_9CHLR|nr:hypothetical protein KDA_46800 [Dictyobacter alpinus]